MIRDFMQLSPISFVQILYYSINDFNSIILLFPNIVALSI